MKYVKPREAIWELHLVCRSDDEGSRGRELLAWLDSLPSEFEILGPGERAVVWPADLTRERIESIAKYETALALIASIAGVVDAKGNPK